MIIDEHCEVHKVLMEHVSHVSLSALILPSIKYENIANVNYVESITLDSFAFDV